MGIWLPSDWQFVALSPQLWWIVPYCVVGILLSVGYIALDRGTSGTSRGFVTTALQITCCMLWLPLIILAACWFAFIVAREFWRF